MSNPFISLPNIQPFIFLVSITKIPNCETTIWSIWVVPSSVGSVTFFISVYWSFSRNFFNKKFWRIIPPFIFWSLIYIFHDFFFIREGSLTFLEFIEIAAKSILSGAKFHLWFVYTLLGLYLFIPILRKWVKYSNSNDILYFLMIWVFTIIYSLPNFKKYLPNIPIVNYIVNPTLYFIAYFSDLNTEIWFSDNSS